MQALRYLQLQMAIMVGSSIVAACAQECGAADLCQAYLVIAGGWGALGVTSIPWRKERREGSPRGSGC